MGQPGLFLIQVFQKRTIWVGLYYLLKIDETFAKGQYGLNCIIFHDFFHLTPV